MEGLCVPSCMSDWARTIVSLIDWAPLRRQWARARAVRLIFIAIPELEVKAWDLVNLIDLSL